MACELDDVRVVVPKPVILSRNDSVETEIV